MRLPHSINNVQPGFYFYPKSANQNQFHLLRVESKDIIFFRINKSWEEFPFVKLFWEDPSDNEIPSSDIELAIELTDKSESEGASVTLKDVKRFNVMY